MSKESSFHLEYGFNWHQTPIYTFNVVAFDWRTKECVLRMKLSTTKQNASTDVIVSLVMSDGRYSPCRGWNCCPRWCGWCCRLWTGWRCCCCPPPRAHSCHHHARLSPSLSASCLSNMRCTGDRSCRIAHVPENRYRYRYCR